MSELATRGYWVRTVRDSIISSLVGVILVTAATIALTAFVIPSFRWLSGTAWKPTPADDLAPFRPVECEYRWLGSQNMKDDFLNGDAVKQRTFYPTVVTDNWIIAPTHNGAWVVVRAKSKRVTEGNEPITLEQRCSPAS